MIEKFNPAKKNRKNKVKDGNLIDRLPKDTFLEILSFLSPKDLIRSCSGVSKRWMFFANNNRLWEKFVEDEYAVFSSGMKCYKVQFETKKIENTSSLNENPDDKRLTPQ